MYVPMSDVPTKEYIEFILISNSAYFSSGVLWTSVCVSNPYLDIKVLWQTAQESSSSPETLLVLSE